MADIFYNVMNVLFETRKELMYAAYEVADNVKIQKLHGFARRRHDITFQDLMSRYSMNDTTVFIHRILPDFNGEYLEIGFRTNGPENLFLFISCNAIYIEEFTNRFGISPRN